MPPSLFISKEAKATALDLLQGGKTRDAIEIILKADLSFGATEPVLQTADNFDAGTMLAKALATLSQSPHIALGVPIGAETNEIRKAYKKMALKYHPDKNPRTTVLFQLIQSCCDRLCDPATRSQEEYNAAHNTAQQPRGSYYDAPGSPTPGPPPGKPPQQQRKPAAAQQQQSHHQQQQHHHHQQQQQQHNQYQQQQQQQQQHKTYDTRPEPAYRQKGAPDAYRNAHGAQHEYRSHDAHTGPYSYNGPEEAYTKQQKKKHQQEQAEAQRKAQQDEQNMYAEFAARRNEADEARRKAAQALREGERNARMDAVRRAQEVAANAKDAQRRRDEEYMSQQTREAMARMHREQVQKEEEERERAQHRNHRQNYYEAGGSKGQHQHQQGGASAAAAAGGKLPKAYQDEMDKVLKSHRDGSSTTEGVHSARGVGPMADQYRQYVNDMYNNKRTAEGSTAAAEKQYRQYQQQHAKDREKEKDRYRDRSTERDGHSHGHGHGHGKERDRSQERERSRERGGAAPTSYRPYGLHCTALVNDVIDLEWTIPNYTPPANPLEGGGSAYAIIKSDLSWRKIDHNSNHSPPWESSGKLVTGTKCRKKNLIVGIHYEFRVRSAVPIPASVVSGGAAATGAIEYSKSEWSEVYTKFIPGAGSAASAGTGAGTGAGSSTTGRSNERRKSEVFPNASAAQNAQGHGHGHARGNSDGRGGPSPVPPGAGGTSSSHAAGGTNSARPSSGHKEKVRLHPVDRRPVDIKPKLGGSGRMAWGTEAAAAATAGAGVDDIPPAEEVVEEESLRNVHATDDGMDQGTKSKDHTPERNSSNSNNNGSENSKYKHSHVSPQNDDNSASHSSRVDGDGVERRLPRKGSKNGSKGSSSHNKSNSNVHTGDSSEDEDANSASVEWYQLRLLPVGSAGHAKEHTVRAKPSESGRIVGYVTGEKFVEVVSGTENGDWCKVRYHCISEEEKLRQKSKHNRSNPSNKYSNKRMGWGWCRRVDAATNHMFLEKFGESTPSEKSSTGKGTINVQATKKKSTGNTDADCGLAGVDFGKVSDDDGGSDSDGDSDEEDDEFDELFLRHKYRERMAQSRSTQRMSTSAMFGSPVPGSGIGAGMGANSEQGNGTFTPKRSFRDAETGDDVWFEEFDDQFNAYYVNQRTGESKWEPPEWVAEVDPETGCTYYIKLNTATAQPLHSTWSKPSFFSKIIRSAAPFSGAGIDEAAEGEGEGEGDGDGAGAGAGVGVAHGGADDSFGEAQEEAEAATPISAAFRQSAANLFDAEAATSRTEAVGDAAADTPHYPYFDLEEDIVDDTVSVPNSPVATQRRKQLGASGRRNLGEAEEVEEEEGVAGLL